MWYYSNITKKIIHSSYMKNVDDIYGKGSFNTLIVTNILVPIDNPSIIDIFQQNGSLKLAAIRYRELHNCNLKEAYEGVKQLRGDMFRIRNVEGRKWTKLSKNEENAEPADSQD